MRTIAFVFLVACSAAHAGIDLIAKGEVPGTAKDRSGLKQKLENGVEANRLGAFGSGLAYTGRGHLFVAVSDRGPNARPFDASVDNTTSYVNRFHTFRLKLTPARRGSPLPYALAPRLISTTLL